MKIESYLRRVLQKYREIFVVIFLVILVFVLATFSSSARSVIHQAVSLFVSSRSVAKIYLLGVFMVFLFFVKNYGGRRSGSPRRYTGPFLVSLLALFLMNVSSYLLFAWNYHLPVHDQTIIFNSGEISSTRFLHNHVFKGAGAELLQYFHHGYFENVDVGTAFLGLVPGWIYLLVAIAFIGVFVLGVLSYREQLPKFDTARSVSAAFTVVFSIALFGLLARSLDGGLFSDGVLAYAVILLVLISPRERIFGRVSVFVCAYSLLLLIFYRFGFFEGQAELVHRFVQNVSIVALLLAPLVFVLEGRLNRLVLLLAIASTLLMVFQLSVDDLLNSYLQMKVTNGSIVARYGEQSGSAYEKVNAIGALNFYSVRTSATSAPRTVADVVADNDLHDNFYPVAVPFGNCNPAGGPVDFRFDITSVEPISNLRFPSFITARSLSLVDQGNGYFRYRIDLSAEPCWPRFINVLDEVIKNEMHGPVFVNHFGENFDD